MKSNYLPILFIVLITSLTACKKESYSITGKWQEVKVVTYNRDNTTGAISGNTTFPASTFGSFDYAQFNNNGTCVLSATGITYNSLQQQTNVQVIQNYTYAKSGSGFALTPVPQNPPIISGIGVTYTVSDVLANTLIIHSVANYLNPSVPYKTISDSYYNK